LGSEVWALARRQHGVVARRQLLEIGVNAGSIEHRIVKGRLHPIWRGVYVIGRPQLTQFGRWMAAVLSCGPQAALSHADAAALWELRPLRGGPIHVSLPAGFRRSHPGIVVHRRRSLTTKELTSHHHIPVTTPLCTLIDLATQLDRDQLEAAINQADKLDLVDPETLRLALEESPRHPGIAALRQTLDRHTFTLTDSELERLFLPLARSAGLPRPETGTYVNGFKVDFHWPDLGLVVETDGLRYHRTPAQQTKDRTRDQAHAAAGLTQLRFTHAQVRFDPRQVEATLTAVTRRLRADRARG
jgi:very-short-patch-repair endonuclease